MERIIARWHDHRAEDIHCSICGARLGFFDTCCQSHALGGLTPAQYVDLFWDEA
jgi:hypothetical protein